MIDAKQIEVRINADIYAAYRDALKEIDRLKALLDLKPTLEAQGGKMWVNPSIWQGKSKGAAVEAIPDNLRSDNAKSK